VLQSLSVRGCRYVDGSFLDAAMGGLKSLQHLDISFTMASLASLGRVLGPPEGPPRLRPGLVGTPAMFNLAFQYERREELEGLLQRLQVAINGADLAATRACLEAGQRLPPIWRAEGATPVPVLSLLLDGPFTDYHVSSLMLAAYMGHGELVRLLLEFGASVHARAVGGGGTLHVTCRVGNLQVAKLLLDQGADPCARTQNGSTPLHTVVSHRGPPQLAALLLSRGAQVDDQAVDRTTALHLACQKGSLEMVRLLLEKGADVARLNANGLSALIYATHYGHVDIVRLLLARGAPDACDSCGARALHHASQAGHAAVVELLLGHGWDLRARTASGKTALMCAAFEGHEAVVGLLLSRGAEAQASTGKGRTALYYAARNGHVAAVRLLLLGGQGGEGPTGPVGEKRPALHCACRKGHALVVDALLESWDPALDGEPVDEQVCAPA
jgi:ankyrin repeat protein